MIAWATQSMMTSASETRRRAAGALRKEIVGCAINGGAESVEVGVQRGLLVDGVVNTADFGLSAPNPLITAFAVESTI
jgi:hypothetical protein